METLAQRVTEAPTVPVETIKTDTPTVETHSTDERPPSLVKIPYIVDMLQIGAAKEHFEMPSLITEINDFVLSEIKRQGGKDDKKTYEEILQKYRDRTRLPEGTDVYSLTEQIAEHIRIDRKLIEAMLAKEELNNKPIEELTSKQLKARIEAL
jgi:hypothetical protein